ncbi:MAG: STAS domain-containing protein [Gemmatimonadetes bacterium]|nr:STAS domain-containing protein [Gemmatimonadota bacterium]
MAGHQSENRYRVSAPVRLIADTRAQFRMDALEHLDRAAKTGAHEYAVDLTVTDEIDASGLGILVLIEKRAREKGMKTVLERPSGEVLHLLDVTRLEYLFGLETEAPAPGSVIPPRAD